MVQIRSIFIEFIEFIELIEFIEFIVSKFDKN